jgi:hypothetical protein
MLYFKCLFLLLVAETTASVGGALTVCQVLTKPPTCAVPFNLYNKVVLLF